ncbi:hypothetical protein Dimus_028010 [Dionaea muscipula]
MHLWMKATLIASTIGGTLVTISILLLIWRFCGRRVCRQVPEEAAAAARSKATTIDQSFQFQAGYRPRANYIYNEAAGDSKMRSNHSPYRIRGGSVSKPPLFSWVDHPDLVTDAAETGWSRFGFVNHSSSMRSPSNSMLGFRESQQQQQQVELSWEVGHGSVDFMQKIRLNNNSSTESAGKKRKMTLMMLLSSSSSSSASCSSSSSSSAFRVKSAIRTSLPLPGPASASSFPQEAYFEITVLAVHDQEQEVVVKDNSRVRGDGEIMTTKLIGGNNNYVHVHGIRNSRSLVHVTSLHTDFDGAGKVMKTSGGGGGGVVRVSLGLATGGPLPLRVPGSFPGSIGFNSNGSIYLDGTKLVYESEKEEWGQVGKVIGCGFDPRQRKVFFVVDSEIVHVIRCKSEEFGTPLFPVLAANVDITVLVNFGQSSFSYTPANSRRTPNPCFVRAAAAAAAALPGLGLGDEDSRELFSMGRIDSGWLNRCTTRSSTATTTTTSIAVNNNNNNNNNNDKGGSFEIDEEFEESDLFEIVLDVTAKSPIKPKL